VTRYDVRVSTGCGNAHILSHGIGVKVLETFQYL
jgi:hypothetical protein